jgi:group I intron endonuclease
MSNIKSGIYSINNLINGKCYVGSAVNIKVRWNTHKHTLKFNCHKNKHLQSAWNKYGKDNFEYKILELVSDLEKLISREQYWIDQLSAFTYGYNMKPKAGSSLGFKFSKESKDKMSKKALGRKPSLETRQKWSLSRKGSNNGMYGKNHTEETIQKMRDNRRNTEGENNHFYGKTHSEETKRKIGDANRGKKLRTILTRDQVIEIKNTFLLKPENKQWKDLFKELSAKFKVSVGAIKKIKYGSRWVDVQV